MKGNEQNTKFTNSSSYLTKKDITYASFTSNQRITCIMSGKKMNNVSFSLTVSSRHCYE